MSANLIWLLWEATLQTLYMVAASTVLGTVFGLPLGVFLATSKRGELLSAPFTNKALGLVVNALRSIPFIARLVENAIREVDVGLIEAARAMGATPMQIITKVLVREARPGIALGLTLAVVSLIGYSAMVGAVGGEGLGDLGIRYGYQRFMPDVMLAVVVILIVLVQLVQSLGEWIAARFDKRAARNQGR